jgi:hypothetical protein
MKITLFKVLLSILVAFYITSYDNVKAQTINSALYKKGDVVYFKADKNKTKGVITRILNRCNFKEGNFFYDVQFFIPYEEQVGNLISEDKKITLTTTEYCVYEFVLSKD